MICIRGAKLYDPSQGLEGQVGDIWIEAGRIVAPPEGTRAEKVIDAAGKILAPAGVEIHSHVAGAQLNTARRLYLGQPAARRMLLPAAAQAAQDYLRLGYTTVMDAAMPPLLAYQTHQDLEQMAGLTRGAYTLMGDHELLLAAVEKEDFALVKALVAWLLEITGGYAVKLVNPGGADYWRSTGRLPELDELLPARNLTQRRFIRTMVAAVNQMGLPHPVHLHAGRLGLPGNSATFCDLVRSLEGQRVHLCHIQFFCYGQDEHGGLTSAVEPVIQALQGSPEISVDVGQVVFGSALATSADVGAIAALHQRIGGTCLSRLYEGGGGGSVLPLTYLEKNAAAAVQWATGLELLLKFPDAGRIFLTSDHPNGGPFTAYPAILHWLMDRQVREELLVKIHPAARKKTGLAGLSREYSLAEVLNMTSAGPARVLGMQDRGHLRPGAAADIRCYRENDDRQAMFARPEWVMRQGELVVEAGQVGEVPAGITRVVSPAWDNGRRRELEGKLAGLLSFAPQNYGLQPWLANKCFEEIPC